MLYPLVFETIYKDKIWGGQKIRSELGKDFGQLPNCGETWEISGIEGNISVVKEGALKGKTLTSLIQEYREALVGKRVYDRFGNTFPLLVKFIDANEDLSIQVHPNDALAMKRHHSFGKTEMWYIIQSDEGSTLVSGFNREMNKDLYLEKLHTHQLNDILNREQAIPGDIFFLPAGRVHTIGKGLLLAEIQQSSDITYRIYDFDRTDDKGQKRELHTELALDAIDYRYTPPYKTSYEKAENKAVKAVECSYFVTSVLSFNESVARDYTAADSFIIYVCVSGSLFVNTSTGKYGLKKGQSMLLPAELKEVRLETSGSFCLLESYVP